MLAVKVRKKRKKKKFLAPRLVYTDAIDNSEKDSDARFTRKVIVKPIVMH